MMQNVVFLQQKNTRAGGVCLAGLGLLAFVPYYKSQCYNPVASMVIIPYAGGGYYPPSLAVHPQPA